MMKAIVVKTDGSVNEVFADWDYQEINNEVGGWIEAVYFGDKPYFAYINEEGKLLDLTPNEIATDLWYESGQRVLLGDFIAGNAVFFGPIDSDGNNTDAPNSLMEELTKIAKRRIRNDA